MHSSNGLCSICAENHTNAEICSTASCYTPFTLQAIYPAVSGIGQNAPVLQLLPEVHMQTCETVDHCPILSASYGSFEMFKIPVSEGQNVSYHQSPSLGSPTIVLISVCASPCQSISVTFRTYFFDVVSEGVIRYDSDGY